MSSFNSYDLLKVVSPQTITIFVESLDTVISNGIVVPEVTVFPLQVNSMGDALWETLVKWN